MYGGIIKTKVGCLWNHRFLTFILGFASFTASIMKEVTIMFLILLLLMIALILIAVTVIAVSVGGSVFILVFSDVIVCIGFIIWLIVKLINRRR
jgi:hypothetical protein